VRFWHPTLEWWKEKTCRWDLRILYGTGYVTFYEQGRRPILGAMTVFRLVAILLFSAVACGQEGSTPDLGRFHTPKPKLPVVDHNACPGNGQTVQSVEVSQDDDVYGSWEGKGASIGTLKAGEKVTVVGGVNVVREPDSAIIKYIGPNEATSPLKVGDIALSYGVEADANVVFWAKGTWFAEWIEAVAEKGRCGFTSGFGQGGCSIDIIKNGKSEWWVQVKTSKGVTGWVLAEKYDGDKRWSGNFSHLCQYGED